MAANDDVFEEFEFRPINEGLGFHRKQKAAANTSASVKTSAPAAAATKSSSIIPSPAMKSATFDLGMDLTETTPATSKNKSPSFNSPLPRPAEGRPETNRPQIQIPTIEDDSISKAQTAVNDILKNLNQKRQIDFIETTAKQKTEYKKSKPQFFASVLDGMLIVSAFLLSLIVMLSITKVDLFMNLSHPQTAFTIYLATAGLFLSIYFIYMVVNRAFVGYTPGEWAFDQVCGTPAQSESLTYIPKLIFRTVLVAATGFFTLTFVSFLFNKDVAGDITGLPLMQKPHA